MNKIHHVICNSVNNQLQVASIYAKSNKKSDKSTRVNPITAALISGFIWILTTQVANAACDVPAPPPSNSSVNCTGVTSGTYTIRNVQNVQLTNESTWNLSGTSLGIINADTGNLTGLVITNKGAMTWDNAQYGGSGTGSRAVINVYTTGNTATKTTTINDSNGVINLNVLSSLGNDRSLAGMAVYGGGTNSRVFWSNAGQINVNSTSNNAKASVAAGFVLGRSQADAVNTGTLTVFESSGETTPLGLGVYIAGGSTVPASATLTNSGTILVSSPTASFAAGVQMRQMAANSGGLPSSFKLNNSGTIKLDTNPATSEVVELISNSVANVSFDIDNSGALLAKDSSGWAVALSGGATQAAKVTLNNTGTIVGNIWTESGDDQVTQTSGSISGYINLSAGSDALMAGGGALIGSTYMGAGDDVASLTGTVDVTAAPQFDGGAGFDTLNVDGLKIKGFTAASNDDTGNDLNKGNNLTQWETINLNNAAKFTLTGELFTAANVGTLNINSASTLDLTQAGTPTTFSVYGDVNNSGIIDMLDNSIGTMATVTGNYTGVAGSTLKMDTVLGDDASATDKLIINGNTTGATSLSVNNVGGTGAKTNEGIRIIEVNGASNGSFTLLGDYVQDGEQAVVGGAYAYKLYKNGISNPSDGNWYLRSQLKPVDTVDPIDPVDPTITVEPLYQAGVPTYEAYPQALLGLNGVPTLQQRVGNRFWAGNGNKVVAQGADPVGTPYAAPEEAGVAIEGNGVWGRIEGAHNSIEPRFSTSATDYDQNVFKLQAGIDGLLTETDSGKLIGGITIHYAHGKTDIDSVYGDGEIRTDGYGFGGTLTWYGENGFYLDGQGQVTWYTSDLNSLLANTSLTDGNDGFGYTLSVESGKRIAIDPTWSVTPQAQLVYSNVDFDAFTDTFGARVSLDRGESLQGRLGLTLDHENSWQNDKGLLNRTHVYGIANLYYEFLEGTRVDVQGVSFASRNDRVWGGLGIGGTYNWDDDKYSIYGEGLVNTSLNNFGDSYSVKGTVGFRMKW